MSNTDVLHVELRESRGSRAARRLRADGKTPVVLYGHGEATVSLSIPTEEIDALLRHRGRVVQLQGAATGDALVRDVQWDTFGAEVLHLDLARVSAGETVETTVPVVLRGDAPGTHHGGVVQHLIHELEIRCPVQSIPETLAVNINHLELNGEITVADLALPAGAEPVGDSAAIVVQCVEPAAEVEAAEVGAEGAEPELIKRREAEDSDE